MTNTFNLSTLELLGYSDAVQISSDENADVYRAKLTAGIEEYPAQFIYVKTRATRPELSRLQVDRSIPIFFVTPESSSLKATDAVALFPGTRTKLFGLDDLIWTRISSAFKDYVSGLAAGIVVEPHFVQPRSDSPNSEPDKEIVEFLSGRSAKYLSGSVLALRAPAAVGKTTLSRMVVQRLLLGKDQYRVIPVYVESSHWSQLRLETVNDLWEVVRNSLMRFAPNLVMSQSLFEVALKTGSIAFIFDGLDELCGRRDVTLSPVDIVDELATIAEGTNSRILLSTRTAYWDSEISRSWPNLSKLDLAPFNRQQALSYFARRFANDMQKQQRSKDLYQRVSEASLNPSTLGGARAQFANLPACVNLIADIVERGSAEDVKIQSPQKIAETMLAFLCGRDRQRKSLTTPPQTQLFAFATLAASRPVDHGPYAIELLDATGFDKSDVLRLVDHPLVRMRSATEFEFAYEFLDSFFKAAFLDAYLNGSSAVIPTDAIALMEGNANGNTPVIEHLVGMNSTLSTAICTDYAMKVGRKSPLAACFLLHLAYALADVEKLSHHERAMLLVKASGSKTINSVERLTLVGSFKRLDFRGLSFTGCNFLNCSLVDCTVDHSTKFNNCVFEGDISLGDPHRLDEWKQVASTNNQADSRASVVVRVLLEASDDRDRDVLIDVFNLGLAKFWHSGRTRRTVEKDNWRRGILAQTPLCDLVLQGFLKSGLLFEIEISGTKSGGYAIDPDSLSDVQKFMDSRALSGKVADAFDFCVQRL